MASLIDKLRTVTPNQWNPARAYLLRDAQAESEIGLANTMANESIDVKTMSVEGVISTDSRSLDRDILESAGVDLSHFSATPTFFLNHNLDLPLGKAMDPSGKLTVRLEGSQLVTRSYFAQSSMVAGQYFALVAEGVLRGLSIRARPDWSAAVEVYDTDKLPPTFMGMRFPKSLMLEYSHVTLPDNRECVTRALSKQFDGKPLCEEIVRALKPFELVAPPWANGWTPETKDMSTPAATTTPAVTPATTPAPDVARDGGTKNPSPDATPREKVTNPTREGAEDKKAEDNGEEIEMLPGAKALSEVHAAFQAHQQSARAVGDLAKSWMGKMENESVRDILESIHGEMTKHSDEMGEYVQMCRDAIEKEYPDLKMEFEDEPDETKPEAEKENADAERVAKSVFWARFAKRSAAVRDAQLDELKELEPVFARILREQQANKKLRARVHGTV